MKNIAILTLAFTIATLSPAEARNGNTGWFVGGLAAGAIAGSIFSSPHAYSHPYPVYNSPPQYIPPTRVECQRQAVYDRFGNFEGHRRICYEIPNY
jgi:hypothetical protein